MKNGSRSILRLLIYGVTIRYFILTVQFWIALKTFREFHDLPCYSKTEKCGFVDERTFCPVVLYRSSKKGIVNFTVCRIQFWLRLIWTNPVLDASYQEKSNWFVVPFSPIWGIPSGPAKFNLGSFLFGVPNFLGKWLLLNFEHISTLMSNRGRFDRGSANDKIFLLQGSTTQACLGVS